jgi:hypothetical protein
MVKLSIFCSDFAFNSFSVHFSRLSLVVFLLCSSFAFNSVVKGIYIPFYTNIAHNFRVRNSENFLAARFPREKFCIAKKSLPSLGSNGLL